MPKLLNLQLMASPYNWVIVVLLVGFALFALSLIAPQEKN